MSYPHLDLAANPHDRAGHRRADEEWLDTRWQDPSSRVLVIAGTRLRPVDGHLSWVPPQQAPEGLRLFLGERDSVAWWAVIVAPGDAPGEPAEWLGLRATLPALGDDAPMVLHAVGLAEWHFVTRHCARCGGLLEPRAAGHELRCPDCGRATFPRTDPAVIVVITHGEPGSAQERCLLGRHPSWPEGRYSTLAGFCEPGERLEDAVRREVSEETGVRVGEVTYFGNQAWPLPSSLMLAFTGVATTEEIVVDGHEIEDARWFTREQLRIGAETGSLLLPRGVSISRSLVEHWYGGTLPGSW